MLRCTFAVVALVCAATLAPAHAQVVPAAGNARVIVKYRADSTLLAKASMRAADRHAAQAEALALRTGLALRAGAGVADRTHVVIADGMTSEALARRLAAEPDIEYAVPDRPVHITAAPNDPLYFTGPPLDVGTGGPSAGQWYLRANGNGVQSSIAVEPAWDVSTGIGVVVAVIDTGIRPDHPDLAGQILPGYDMVSDATIANDGDGRDADPSDPGDWVSSDDLSQPGVLYQCAPAAQNSSWHGTQTSALIGALTNNGIGMASVAPGVRLLPVRALGKCGHGFDSDVMAAMLWAAGIDVPGVPHNANPARVLNLSLGAEGPCTSAYSDAVAQINAAGAVVVASAGNSTGHAVGAPANCPGVIGVAGLRHIGTKVGFSDIGPEVAISAPGGNCVNTGTGEPCLYPILSAVNSGKTTPIADVDGGSTYTDSFHFYLGTSFSAPLVAGTAALMLSARPSLTPAQVRALLQASARPFPTTGASNNPDGTPVVACNVPAPAGTPQVDQLECYCTTSTCGAGMLDAGGAVLAAKATTSPNYTGLFWNAPAGSESGWGINFAHQGDLIYATWFTYDTRGKAWWLSMLASRNAPSANVYSGTIYADTGPAFNAFTGTAQPTAVGSGTLAFANADNGTFSYTVNTVSQTKQITRFNLGTGAQPVCFYSSMTPNVVGASNYQDLWWVAQGAEAGWGINFAQQGDTIFATWYTYDVDHTPLWMTSLAQRQPASNVFTGTLYRTAGPRFDAYDARQMQTTPVGTATFTFADGDHATFAYNVQFAPLPGPVAQTKQLTRFPLVPSGGVVCQ